MKLEDLIQVLKEVSISSDTHIPIELVIQLDRLRKEINQLENPYFIGLEGNQVNQYWEEFKGTGLNNMDYITTEFYKEGFNEDN